MEQFRCNQMVPGTESLLFSDCSLYYMCGAEVIYNTRSHTFAINLP